MTMIKKVDHIGIIVQNLDQAIENFSAIGLGVSKRVVASNFNSEIAFLPCGDLTIELVMPIGPGNGQNWLREHGEGLHHICFDVNDLSVAHEDISKTIGVREDGIKPGAEGKDVFFANKEHINNVLVEITTLNVE